MGSLWKAFSSRECKMKPNAFWSIFVVLLLKHFSRKSFFFAFNIFDGDLFMKDFLTGVDIAIIQIRFQKGFVPKAERCKEWPHTFHTSISCWGLGKSGWKRSFQMLLAKGNALCVVKRHWKYSSVSIKLPWNWYLFFKMIEK